MTPDPPETSSAAPVPPVMVGRDEAARMFGIALGTWKSWETDGRVPRSVWTPMPGAYHGKIKAHPLAELKPLLEEYRKIGKPYPDPDRPGCWRVPLMGFGPVKREAIVDAESLPLVEGKRWNWKPRWGESHAVVALSGPSGGQTPMQRLITGVTGPPWRITHANGDPLDCRRSNLIVRNLSQQSASARKRPTLGGRPCSSRFKGVFWNTQKQKWTAKISTGGKQRHLGNFRDEMRAAEAYDEALWELFGEHARLNFPDRPKPQSDLARAA